MSGNNFQVPFINTDKYNGKYFDKKYKVKNRACMGCPLHCGCYYSLKDGTYAGLNWGKIEYGSIDGFVTRIGVDDIEFGMVACHYADEQGIDAITLGAVLSFAFECYEKGILSIKETDNIPLDWGNKISAMALMKKVVNREGLGDILAQGSVKASEIIGKESHRFTLTTKGLDHVEADPRGLNAWGLGYAVSTRGADHLRALPAFEMSITPERAKELFGSEEAGDRFATSGKTAMVKWYEELRAFEDSMEICKFVARTELNFPGPLAEIYKAVTGIELQPDEVLMTGERIINVEKAFNSREGLTKKDDTLPERFLKEPLPFGSAEGHVCKLEPMLDDYYSIRGWDVETGLQTRHKLEMLGLEQLALELENMGLLR